MISKEHDVIIAQCTPQGAGALALLRICGNGAVQLIDCMARIAGGKKLIDMPSHTIHYGMVIDDQHQVIDHVMFLLMYAPKTFTGLDTVEITCHNNQFLIERIIQQALQLGARAADHGEFSRRAYLNNKLDLLQAEAINELIQASSEAELKQSLAQLSGSLSHKVQELERRLIHALALSDASFEFLDEENIEFGNTIKEIVSGVINDIEQLKLAFDQRKHIRQGIRVALVGSVNAGKSSLFNCLVGVERAIVNARAGTTRDMIEYGIYQDGLYVTYVDTAGLRQTEDEIEQSGIIRSYEQAGKADIIILVSDSARNLTEAEQSIYDDIRNKYAAKILEVFNKYDEGLNEQSAHDTCIRVSCHSGYGIERLKQKINQRIQQLFNYQASPFSLNKRHMHVLLDISHKLKLIDEQLNEQYKAYELISYALNDVLQTLSLLSGKSVSDNAMDAIFKEFCIGK